MRDLYVTYARTRNVFGARTYGARSRFLDEIPLELTDREERGLQPGAPAPGHDVGHHGARRPRPSPTGWATTSATPPSGSARSSPSSPAGSSSSTSAITGIASSSPTSPRSPTA